MIRRTLRGLGQIIAFLAFFALIAYLSAQPVYEHRDPELAQIAMSFSHTGPRETECRKLTAEEIQELAANMRRTLDCPRGRLPLSVQLELDQQILYQAELPPAGIAGDGSSFVYVRLSVPSGPHELIARLRDTRRASGYDHVKREIIDLNPRQNFTIDFRPETGGFVFR